MEYYADEFDMLQEKYARKIQKIGLLPFPILNIEQFKKDLKEQGGVEGLTENDYENYYNSMPKEKSINFILLIIVWEFCFWLEMLCLNLNIFRIIATDLNEFTEGIAVGLDYNFVNEEIFEGIVNIFNSIDRTFAIIALNVDILILQYCYMAYKLSRIVNDKFYFIAEWDSKVTRLLVNIFSSNFEKNVD